jgi:hypothetical protein
MKHICALSLGLASLAAVAHDGHGMDGTHWHATDLWGFAAALAVAGAALWLRGRK